MWIIISSAIAIGAYIAFTNRKAIENKPVAQKITWPLCHGRQQRNTSSRSWKSTTSSGSLNGTWLEIFRRISGRWWTTSRGDLAHGDRASPSKLNNPDIDPKGY